MYVCMNGCMVQKLLSPRCLLQCYYSYINFLVGFGFMHGVFVVFIEYLALRFDFHQNIIDEVHRKCCQVVENIDDFTYQHRHSLTVNISFNIQYCLWDYVYVERFHFHRWLNLVHATKKKCLRFFLSWFSHFATESNLFCHETKLPGYNTKQALALMLR